MRLDKDAAPGKPKQTARKAKQIIGDGKVRLVQNQSGDWQLQLEGKPYVIKGITYAPVKVGQSPDEGTLGNWVAKAREARGGDQAPLSESERAELARLRTENAELRMQRDVLKRSTALWVNEAMRRSS